MLIGEYEYNIDQNGRLNFPAKLRDSMGETFILSKSVDEKCLYAYPLESWREKQQKLKELPAENARVLQRYLFSSASETGTDKQGRIIIPQTLRDFASLQKEVIIIGADDRCEIWDKGEWQKYNSNINDNAMRLLASKMGF